MSQIEKLKGAFANCQKTFKWRDFVKLLEGLGYKALPKGKTGGSRRKYFNKGIDHMIYADEPHDGQMTRGMVKRLQQELKDRGLI